MKRKYAVAITNGDVETILGIFDTKEEADRYGINNIIPHCDGLQYCYSANFRMGKPVGNIKVYDYYNCKVNFEMGNRAI